MDSIPVNIPSELYERVKRRVEASNGEFESVEEYVKFVLTEVVKDTSITKGFTKEEEQEIKERLEKLGYGP